MLGSFTFIKWTILLKVCINLWGKSLSWLKKHIIVIYECRHRIKTVSQYSWLRDVVPLSCRNNMSPPRCWLQQLVRLMSPQFKETAPHQYNAIVKADRSHSQRPNRFQFPTKSAPMSPHSLISLTKTLWNIISVVASASLAPPRGSVCRGLTTCSIFLFQMFL